MLSSIGKQLTQQRSRLALSQRKQAEHTVNQQLIEFVEKRAYKRVAVYLAIKGELSLAPLIDWLFATQREVYAPKVDVPTTGEMQFFPLQPQTKLETAHFGLREPLLEGEPIVPQALELVCVPMVGFHGVARIGWGKGYYDRYFSFRLNTKAPPLLAGVAFAQQQHQGICAKPWDVPMDLVFAN